MSAAALVVLLGCGCSPKVDLTSGPIPDWATETSVPAAGRPGTVIVTYENGFLDNVTTVRVKACVAADCLSVGGRPDNGRTILTLDALDGPDGLTMTVDAWDGDTGAELGGGTARVTPTPRRLGPDSSTTVYVVEVRLGRSGITAQPVESAPATR
jgi:hypothetical protein